LSNIEQRIKDEEDQARPMAGRPAGTIRGREFCAAR